MARKKQLSYTNIKKDDKKLDEKIVVNIDEYTFNIDKTFRDSKMMNLMSEVIVNTDRAKKEGIDLEAIFVPYTMLMMMKHFTNVTVPEKISEQVAFIYMLIDRDLFARIVDSFPRDEVEKIYGKFQKLAEEKEEAFDEIMKELEELEAKNMDKVEDFLAPSEDDVVKTDS